MGIEAYSLCVEGKSPDFESRRKTGTRIGRPTAARRRRKSWRLASPKVVSPEDSAMRFGLSRPRCSSSMRGDKQLHGLLPSIEARIAGQELREILWPMFMAL